MKIKLDLDQLLKNGKISQQEYQRLQSYAEKDISHLVFNILIVFGLLSISLYLLSLAPMASLIIMIAVALTAVGGLLLWRSERFAYLGRLCLVLAAIGLSGGFIWGQHFPFNSPWVVLAVLLAYAAVTENSVLLILAVCNLFFIALTLNFYQYATETSQLANPLFAIIAMAVLALLMLKPSLSAPQKYQRLAIITARSSLFLMYIAFWIGSIWSEHALSYAISWATVLLITAVWAWRYNKRWVMNVNCIFAMLHIYTQWLLLNDSPLSLLFAGVIAIGFAVGMRLLNRHFPAD